MSFLEFKNIRIAGISAGVPRKKICNLNDNNISKDYDAVSFVEVTGVKERRIDDLTVSDLAVPAAESLLRQLGWNKNDIDGILVVTRLIRSEQRVYGI